MRLPAELTHAQASACWYALEPQIVGSAQSHLGIDASDLTVFDSSALAVLLACRRAALAAGKSLAIQGLPPGLQAISVLYGVQPLLSPSDPPAS